MIVPGVIPPLNSGIHACETVPGRVITIIVESALIGYVCIGLYKPVGGNCFCVKEFFSCMWKFVMLTCFAPVIYIYIYFYFVVTLAIFHLRAPPTLDDGDLSDTVGREDDGGFLGPQ